MSIPFAAGALYRGRLVRPVKLRELMIKPNLEVYGCGRVAKC
jgi:hypothetical protein